MRGVPAALAAALTAAAALAAGAALAQHGATGPGGDAAVVSVTDGGVTPTDRVVPPGSRVRWVNVGNDRHTVTADDGSFDSLVMQPGEEFTLTAPATRAVIPYHCRIHAFIRGTLTVSAVSLAAPARVPWGGAAHLTGTVPGAAAGTPVVIERRARGAWVPAAAPVTGAGGAFSARLPRLTGRTVVRARTGDEVSPAARIAVPPRIGLTRAGLTLRLRVSPPPRGRVALILERLDLDTYRWRPVARRGVAGADAVRVPRTGVWRVRIPRPGPGLAEGVSRGVAVTAAGGRPPAARPAGHGDAHHRG